jgi:hypothetical protein
MNKWMRASKAIDGMLCDILAAIARTATRPPPHLPSWESRHAPARGGAPLSPVTFSVVAGLFSCPNRGQPATAGVTCSSAIVPTCSVAPPQPCSPKGAGPFCGIEPQTLWHRPANRLSRAHLRREPHHDWPPNGFAAVGLATRRLRLDAAARQTYALLAVLAPHH